jgi:hypothetical protein
MLGWVLNGVIRAWSAYFLWEVMTNRDDARFRDKAIPERNLVVNLSLMSLFPIWHLVKRTPLRQYPVWSDNVYLSLFWLDMAGNSWNLYDRYKHFDLIPHAHGGGAAAIAFASLLNVSPLTAMGLSNTVHILLEGQEFLTDVLAGTKNVRGTWDMFGDLHAGVAGSALYSTLLWLIGKRNAS